MTNLKEGKEALQKEAKSQRKKTVTNTEKPNDSFNSYEVKSKGYLETFTSLEAANNQADILKKRAIKNGDGVSIQVNATRQNDDKKHLIRNIKIDESFFQE